MKSFIEYECNFIGKEIIFSFFSFFASITLILCGHFSSSVIEIIALALSFFVLTLFLSLIKLSLVFNSFSLN